MLFWLGRSISRATASEIAGATWRRRKGRGRTVVHFKNQSNASFHCMPRSIKFPLSFHGALQWFSRGFSTTLSRILLIWLDLTLCRSSSNCYHSQDSSRILPGSSFVPVNQQQPTQENQIIRRRRTVGEWGGYFNRINNEFLHAFLLSAPASLAQFNGA